jgi:hypothetical protein
MRSPFIILAAAALLLATGARAQDAQLAAAPTCAEQGMQRIAVMVPPGRTVDEVRELARTGALAPAGTEVFILPAGHFTRLKNEQLYRERMNRMLQHFLDRGTKVDGNVSILLLLDESGAVAEVHPNTRNRQLDRELLNTWKDLGFEPYVIDGCRVRAYIHVPFAFTSDYGFTRSEIEVKPVPP